jgi:hypothetical protein
MVFGVVFGASVIFSLMCLFVYMYEDKPDREPFPPDISPYKSDDGDDKSG